MALPRENEHYTYADYLTWDDDNDERWELIDGVPYAMAPPAPSPRHQSITTELLYMLRHYLKGKPCKVFPAPFDVRLGADEYDDTVVQPDIVVICDKSKLDNRGCKGAPDLVIEILSPATAKKDRIIKLERYRRAGVREYWLADPDTKSVQVCILRDGLYFIRGYADDASVPVAALPGCVIRLPEIFAE